MADKIFLIVDEFYAIITALHGLKCQFSELAYLNPTLESVQDCLIKLDMRPCLHLVEISILLLNLFIVRLTKIMKRADKNWALF